MICGLGRKGSKNKNKIIHFGVFFFNNLTLMLNFLNVTPSPSFFFTSFEIRQIIGNRFYSIKYHIKNDAPSDPPSPIYYGSAELGVYAPMGTRDNFM